MVKVNENINFLEELKDAWGVVNSLEKTDVSGRFFSLYKCLGLILANDSNILLNNFFDDVEEEVKIFRSGEIDCKYSTNVEIRRIFKSILYSENYGLGGGAFRKQLDNLKKLVPVKYAEKKNVVTQAREEFDIFILILNVVRKRLGGERNIGEDKETLEIINDILYQTLRIIVNKHLNNKKDIYIGGYNFSGTSPFAILFLILLFGLMFMYIFGGLFMDAVPAPKECHTQYVQDWVDCN